MRQPLKDTLLSRTLLPEAAPGFRETHLLLKKASPINIAEDLARHLSN